MTKKEEMTSIGVRFSTLRLLKLVMDDMKTVSQDDTILKLIEEYKGPSYFKHLKSFLGLR